MRRPAGSMTIASPPITSRSGQASNPRATISMRLAKEMSSASCSNRCRQSHFARPILRSSAIPFASGACQSPRAGAPVRESRRKSHGPAPEAASRKMSGCGCCRWLRQRTACRSSPASERQSLPHRSPIRIGRSCSITGGPDFVMMRAGCPTAVEPAGMSLSTTAMAPILQPSPTCTSPNTWA